MRAGNVECLQAVAQVQGFGDDAGILPVLEWQAGRGKVDTLDAVPSGAAQRVAGRFDGHGDGILVPVGDRSLALAETSETGIEPGMGLGNNPALQTQARHVAAKGVDPNRHGQTISTRPLSSTVTRRSRARERKDTTSPSRQISVRISSPGYTGAEKRSVSDLNREGS